MRLLVPMIVVGTLYFVIQYLVPGTNNKGDITRMWRIYFFHIPLLVLALAVSYLHDTVVHRSLQKDGKPPPVGGVVCDCHITECGERPRNDARVPNLFSFKGALGQLPYFLQVWAPAGLRGSFVVQAALSVCLCGWRRSWVWH